MRKEMKPRHEMPRQPADLRAKNFKEVALGYTEEMAVEEAQRCLQCKTKQCVAGCPVRIDIPAFVKAAAEGNFAESARILKDKNSLPAICGRVCPQEEQCEKVCVLGKTPNGPVAIGRIERFIADWEAAQGAAPPPVVSRNGMQEYAVAVVGSGPASLTVASELAKMGYTVTMFEALHSPGGVLRYGIPEFRLPRDILDREIDYVRSLGVNLFTNVVIGRTVTIQQLFDEGFDAIFVGSGAGAPSFLKIPGENLNGVLSANEFLTRVNLMAAHRAEAPTPVRVPRKAAIIGAGNTAMDCARCALRIGAEEVMIVYRRSRAEAPARKEEIENAEEEGVKFMFLNNPLRFVGDENGWLKEMVCQKMELGEPDASGRRRPVPIPNSEFTMEVDTAIIAIGQTPNPLIRQTTEGLQTQSWGGIIIDEKTGATSIPGVYAGGDAVTGEATVITAMGAGKVASAAIDRYVREKHGLPVPEAETEPVEKT